MLTEEYINRLKTNISNAITNGAKNITLTINYTNGKSDVVKAKDDGSFIQSPRIIVDAFNVVGQASNIGEVESSDATTETHSGDYYEVLKPLSIVESIDLKYRGKVVKTISADVTQIATETETSAE